LREVHLKFNSTKCCFGIQNITFLGHVVSVEGYHLDPKKIVVKKFPIPKLVTNVKAFMGLTGYYRKFILGYAKIVKPLFGLIKDNKFLWKPNF